MTAQTLAVSIVGRTGSGKTALIKRLHDTTQNVIVLAPESLALGYISNSTVLQFVMGFGVKLDIFFRLLWRHVLIVEFIQHFAQLDSAATTKTFFDKLRDRFDTRRRHNMSRALTYLERFGHEFWQETDYRIKEVTSKVENDLRSTFKSAGLPLEVGFEAGRGLTTEQREEVIQRAQHVVNTIQMRELSEMMELLNEILDDPKQKFYIVIDRLDEDWVDDKLRYANSSNSSRLQFSPSNSP